MLAKTTSADVAFGSATPKTNKKLILTSLHVMESIFKRLDTPQKMKHTLLGQNLNKTRLVSNRVTLHCYDIARKPFF